MSALSRVKHWNAFAQVWHLFDAKWQNPFESATVITKYLLGKHKPFYHPFANCGDVVVVINSRHIALLGDEWKKRVYFHHTGYPGGASWTLAWELHEKSPTMILEKAVYSSMKGNLQRRHTMKRLIIYPEDTIPEDIHKNISSQIKQLRKVPKVLESDEVNNFPRIVNLPFDYVPS
ncbi:large ribosomal subunit protein uL13m [Halyomorpha halys]|uniref:large ribosomal subunit protein uL13m n=1 Tax=Halyomorpha halys TaxID=286706 RepID=UPI0006D50D08|nr:39S ribosomal protein L13, mitochondrial [Halyomorpha halys]